MAISKKRQKKKAEKAVKLETAPGESKFIELTPTELGYWMDGTNEARAVASLTKKGLMINGKFTSEGERSVAENFRILRRSQKESMYECVASQIGEFSKKARSGNIEAKKDMREYIATVNYNNDALRKGREYRLSPSDKSRIRDKIRKISASYHGSPVEALDALLYIFEYELGDAQSDEIFSDECYYFAEVGKKLVANYVLELKQNIKFASEDSKMKDVLASMSEYAVEKLLERNQKKLLSFFKAKSEKKETR